jgi:hypothetical protein
MLLALNLPISGYAWLLMLASNAAWITYPTSTAENFSPTSQVRLRSSRSACARKGEASLAAKIGAQIHAVSRSMPKYGESIVGTIGGMQVILQRYDGLVVVIQSRDGVVKYTPNRTGVHINMYAESGSMVLEKIEDLIDEPARQIKLAQRLEDENRDIAGRLQQGFDHQEKLEQLMERQRAIDAELDLDKDEAGAIEATEESPTS